MGGRELPVQDIVVIRLKKTPRHLNDDEGIP